VRDRYQTAITNLHRQITDEHTQNLSIKQVIAMQQEQMHDLAEMNAAMLKEMSDLRREAAGEPPQ